MEMNMLPQLDSTILGNVRVIIGLGNPGSKYRFNRHNAGMLVVEHLAQALHLSFENIKNFKLARHHNNKSVCLVLPQTFMNNSGDVLSEIFKLNKVSPDQILVIHDELEKKAGSLSIRLGGSSRWHNGLKSLMQHIGEDFYRLRLGIGRPENRSDVANYVLTNLSNSEVSFLEEVAKKIATIYLSDSL